MKTRPAFFVSALFCILFGVHAQAPPSKVVDFESDAPGKTPAGFSTALTGGGGPVRWEIKEDPTAPEGKKVLAQTSADSTDYRFPLCIYDGLQFKDGSVNVHFKAVSGKVDQAAGIVIRYIDKDNYYIVRANALENNVRLYRVVKGERIQFAGARHTVATGQWHRLALGVRGSHFNVYYDGAILFDADDKMFSEAGKVGLWTKADSVTYFDNFVIVPLDARKP
ncbi:MAG: hypothetical protein HY046_11285 [Acidobacteria bacterium]|nr:hypothetical protein [Acidobacteriota bacterium]